MCEGIGSLGSGGGSLGLGSGRGRSGFRCLVVSLRSLSSSGVGLATVRRRPEGEVVAQELHDERAVAVGLFGEAVELGNGIVEGLLGEMAGTVG